MTENDLIWLHEVLLHVEKERLWKELSSDLEEDRQAGKLLRLPEIIRQVRTDLKRA